MSIERFTFKYGDFLQRNDRTIEAVDISSEYLRHLAEQNEDSIRHILQATPVVFLARLALRDQEHIALSQRGTTGISSTHTHFSAVSEVFTPYWSSLSGSRFRPIVRSGISGRGDGIDGTWIGGASKIAEK